MEDRVRAAVLVILISILIVAAAASELAKAHMAFDVRKADYSSRRYRRVPVEPESGLFVHAAAVYGDRVSCQFRGDVGSVACRRFS